jgi:transcriptional regulator with XRE-family HTH domain
MLDSDLTQESLGKKLGVKQGMISNWLRGYRNPSLVSLKKIAIQTSH